MKDIMKKATIKVRNLRQPDLSEKIEDSLIHVLGINKVKVDYKKKRVRIDYNLRFITYYNLINKLTSIGYPATNNIISEIKKAFIDFTEKNEMAGINDIVKKRKSIH